jgi:hypothetical protein
MESPIITAIGALGAWLLVAGLLDRASMELREQGLAQRRELPPHIPHPRWVSAWWWLLPPVAYWKHHSEEQRLRRVVLAALPTDEVRRMISFSNTARCWLVVAGGATLIGVKETWEFVETLGWAAIATWAIAAAALLLSAGNAAITPDRTDQILAGIGSDRI